MTFSKPVSDVSFFICSTKTRDEYKIHISRYLKYVDIDFMIDKLKNKENK